MKIKSIKFKIRILFVALLGVFLTIYSIYLYFSLYVTLYDEIDDELYAKAKEIAKALDTYRERTIAEDFTSTVKKVIVFKDFPDPDDIEPYQLQWLQKVDSLNLKENYIDFLNANGKSLVKSNNLKNSLLFLNTNTIEGIKDGAPYYKRTKLNNKNIRVVSFPYRFENNSFYIIQVGTSLRPTIYLLKNRLIHILISIPIILLISSLLGKMFVTKLLKPVYEITKTANMITNENLSSRVNRDRIDEEMQYLVDAFNKMISRLESSFKYISEFSSQVAHELKTPLTIIKGESDITLRKERGREEYIKTIKLVMEETERMLKVIENLLLLTRLDFPLNAFNFEQVNLIELLKEIYEKSKILALHKDITVDMTVGLDKLLINGDKLHLRRLFLNLIDNSIKFTDYNGKIHITAAVEDKRAIITITDTGVGIVEEDLPKIFDRFFHIDRTGKLKEPSTGLGLSIVKSITDIHNGQIDVKSKSGEGTTFTILLPVL
ncbi:MAG: GHKL domain-containing protein [Spirochaetota bacterium]|nr:MAG: GHKL domain-containing protein [Spirochaetota bacterium]